MQAQSAGEGIAPMNLQPGSTRRWVDSIALRQYYPQERPANYRTVLHFAATTSSPAFCKSTEHTPALIIGRQIIARVDAAHLKQPVHLM